MGRPPVMKPGSVTVLVLLALGCRPMRAQLVATVSSDLLLPAMVDADDSLSGAAVVDRVRVLTLDGDGATIDHNEFVVDQSSELPLSFGVAAPDDQMVRLRVLGFSLRWTVQSGSAIDPLPGVAIDRLLLASVRSVEKVNLTLTGDCFGWPSDLAASTTCAEGTGAAAPADVPSATLATTGSWSPAHAVPCSTDAPGGTVCIPGGASIVGDPALVTVDATSDFVPSPPRMVVLSPFFMDRHEMTVAGLRALAALPPLPEDPACNYRATPGATDDQAVRCVPFATARAACRALGGDLPTAAEWEHAARGRGRQWRYPWGDDPPTCCAAALAANFGCSPNLQVGSHDAPPNCAGLADLSRDGVSDLAGSVREWVLDAALDFDSCLGAGVLTDPDCVGATPGSVKGGSFATPFEGAAAALRASGDSLNDVGFRCVRPAQ